MLRRILLDKPEPLLLLFPLLLAGLFLSSGLDTAIMLQHDRELFWVGFSCVLLPLLLHFFLRTSRRWDTRMGRIQVYGTLVLLLLFFTVILHPPVALKPGIYWWNQHLLYACLFIMTAVWQLSFTGYFLWTIFRKQPKNRQG